MINKSVSINNLKQILWFSLELYKIDKATLRKLTLDVIDDLPEDLTTPAA